MDVGNKGVIFNNAIANNEKDVKKIINTDALRTFCNTNNEEDITNDSNADSKESKPDDMKPFVDIGNVEDVKQSENVIDEEDSNAIKIKPIKISNEKKELVDESITQDMKPFVNLGNTEVFVSDLNKSRDEDKATNLISKQEEILNNIENKKINKTQSGLQAQDDFR